MSASLFIFQISENALFVDASRYKSEINDDQLQHLILQLEKSALNNKADAFHPSFKLTNSVVDAVPGMFNLTLYCENHLKLDLLEQALISLWEQLVAQGATDSISHQTNREIIIPTIYGLGSHQHLGPDLGIVAKHNGLSPEQVVALHSQAIYQVYFIGFQPGFAYLGGLTPQLYTPRKKQPRKCIPKGSVAIGGEQTGIYPNDSPGGWQIIGHSQIQLFDFDSHDSPCLLKSGDKVRFKAVTQYA